MIGRPGSPGLFLSMQSWRLIHSGALRGAMNMALDEALFEAVARGDSPPVVRLYRWEPATVTLGYAQRDARAINFAACRELGFDVVRRSTGGRAVLHQHEVTYALIAPIDHPLFAGGILESYRAIARPLQEMLTGFGVEVELVPARRTAASSQLHDICFTAPASYELAVAGRKIAGSAQKRNERAFLQHGSIPVDLDPEVMARVLSPPDLADLAAAANQLRDKVGWINRYQEIPLTLERVEAAMEESFVRVYPGHWEVGQPTEAEWQRARQLCAERFYVPEWNGDEPQAPDAIDRCS